MSTTVLTDRPGEGSARGPAGGRLWNRSFLLLWQGQLVSAVGDVAYEIALGFWILIATGSTGLMGALMAASMLPRIALAPVAGTWVDRSDRKRLLVTMDAIRGIAVLLVGVAALAGVLQVWMVFAAGIVIGLAGAVFNPAVGSVVPDLVGEDRLVRANSYFSMIRAGSGIVGNTAGGLLFTILGAPLMFLLNGLSYLFSALSELFIRVPAIHHRTGRPHFWADMTDGMTFAWRSPGLRFFLTAAAIVNFTAMIGYVLILPLFQRTPGLGPARYGVLLAALTGGMLLGMACIAAVRVHQGNRLAIVVGSFLGTALFWGVFPLFERFELMLPFVALGGVCNGVLNVLVQSLVQMRVPQAMRGKIMGLLETATGGLVPLGVALGGLLGEFLPLRPVICASFLAVALLAVPLALSKGLRAFVQD